MISNLYPNPNSYCFDDVDVMTEISKLKYDIATRHTAEREEKKHWNNYLSNIKQTKHYLNHLHLISLTLVRYSLYCLQKHLLHHHHTRNVMKHHHVLFYIKHMGKRVMLGC